MRFSSSVLQLIVIAALAGALAFAQKPYVLEAANWGANQRSAVASAGGELTFVHAGTGIALARSANPNFAQELLATRLFRSAAEDIDIQWQPPVREGGVVEAAVTPANETFWNIQWHMRAVEAPAAWAANATGRGVRVAIVDGGIHSTHIDLAPNLDTARSASFVPGFAFNQDTGTFWHATHVAGIVAAAGNNIGTIGIAPEATIVGVKVLHNGSGTFGQVIQGILYAATPIAQGGAGADIINLSLGAAFPRGGGNTGAAALVSSLNRAVNYADRFGVLVVAAAGNNGLDLDHSGSAIIVPAQSGSAVAVSATGPLGFALGATNFRRPASYTNYGVSAVNVAAPGGDFALPGSAMCSLPRIPSGNVTSYCWVFDMVLSTVRGSGASISSYGWAAGTSMAAPMVSGIAALVKQKYPGIPLGALKTQLQRTADDEGPVGADPFYGKGFVNARKAVGAPPLP
jgi:subtilisin family serine protease